MWIHDIGDEWISFHDKFLKEDETNEWYDQYSLVYEKFKHKPDKKPTNYLKHETDYVLKLMARSDTPDVCANKSLKTKLKNLTYAKIITRHWWTE